MSKPISGLLITSSTSQSISLGFRVKVPGRRVADKYFIALHFISHQMNGLQEAWGGHSES